MVGLINCWCFRSQSLLADILELDILNFSDDLSIFRTADLAFLEDIKLEVQTLSVNQVAAVGDQWRKIGGDRPWLEHLLIVERSQAEYAENLRRQLVSQLEIWNLHFYAVSAGGAGTIHSSTTTRIESITSLFSSAKLKYFLSCELFSWGKIIVWLVRGVMIEMLEAHIYCPISRLVLYTTIFTMTYECEARREFEECASFSLLVGDGRLGVSRGDDIPIVGSTFVFITPTPHSWYT